VADLAPLSTDDQLRAFTTFVTSLLHNFAQYLDHTAPVDREGDGVRYNTGTIYLGAAEFEQVQAGLRALLLPLLAPSADGDRRPHRFATVLFPATDPPADETERERPLP
jgi:hypothetical protein